MRGIYRCKTLSLSLAVLHHPSRVNIASFAKCALLNTPSVGSLAIGLAIPDRTSWPTSKTSPTLSPRWKSPISGQHLGTLDCGQVKGRSLLSLKRRSGFATTTGHGKLVDWIWIHDRLHISFLACQVCSNGMTNKLLVVPSQCVKPSRL